MNQNCSKCKKECYYLDFNTMEYFCEICLNKCEVVTDLTDCNKIFEKYTWIEEIPKIGASGFLYIVFNKDRKEKTFLKVQSYTSYLNKRELYISCLVSNLPNFVKTYNYWICDEEPVDKIWKESTFAKKLLKEKSPTYKDKISFIEMKKYEGSLSDLLTKGTQLKYHDKVSICFELFNAMKRANDEFGFIHNDFNYGNVLYEFNNNTRTYEIEIINENKKRISLTINCSSIFFPVWADFGKSEILKGEPEYRSYDEDIEDEDRSFQDYIFNILDRGFNIWTQVIDKLGKKTKTGYNKTNQQFLEWLGRLVIESEEISQKKQRIKNLI